jgi:hypothetical protein
MSGWDQDWIIGEPDQDIERDAFIGEFDGAGIGSWGGFVQSRTDVSAAVPASLTDELRREIGQPDIIRPLAGVDRDRVREHLESWSMERLLVRNVAAPCCLSLSSSAHSLSALLPASAFGTPSRAAAVAARVLGPPSIAMPLLELLGRRESPEVVLAIPKIRFGPYARLHSSVCEFPATAEEAVCL